MRRVYYAYAIRMATHPFFIHGVVMGALLLVLTYFVSIPNVFVNTLDVRVGELAPHLFRALQETEVWTLLILGSLIFTTLSLQIHLRMFRIDHKTFRSNTA